MRKIIEYIIVPCFALAIGACTKEVPSEAGETAEMVLNMPDGLKTGLGSKTGSSYPVYWTAGDVVGVNGKTVSVGGAYDGKATAKLVVKPVTAPYNVVYPGRTGIVDSVEIPSTQAYTPNSFASGSVPMYASSNDLGQPLEMEFLSSVIKIPVTGSSNIVSITLSADGGEAVAGEFRIGKTGGLLDGSIVPETGHSSVSIDCGSGVALSSDATAFFVSVAPGTYTKGLRATILSGEEGNNCMELLFCRASDNNTLQPGKVYELGEVEFAAAKKVVTISTAAELEAFMATEDTDAVGYVIKDIESYNTETPAFVAALDGMGHKVSGLKGPFITELSGTVKNLTVEARISNATTVSNKVAIFARNVSGLIQDCASEGSISYKSTSTTKAVYLGGFISCLAGGTLKGCVNRADVTMPDRSGISLAGQSNFGGLVALLSSGTITGCSNEGTVTVKDEYDGATTNYVCIGGLLGRNNSSSNRVSGCSNSGKVTVDTPNQSCVDYQVGGLVGRGVVLDSVNEGDVEVSAKTTANLYVGGCAGYTTALFDGLANMGSVSTSACSADALYLAGCTAYYGNGGNVTELRNEGNVSSSSDNVGTRMCVGGLFGYLNTNSEKTISGDVVNSGNITVTELEASNPLADIGGFAGRIKSTKATVLTGFVNSGDITVNGCCGVDYPGESFCAGGVIGYADASVSLAVTSCTNDGSITLPTAGGSKRLNLAGIVAQPVTAAYAESATVNHGNIIVTGSCDTLAMAGHVAAIYNEKASSYSITGNGKTVPCNTGTLALYDRGSLSTFPVAGGIVGKVMGRENLVSLTLENCCNGGVIDRKPDYTLARYQEEKDEEYILPSHIAYAGGIVGIISRGVYDGYSHSGSNCNNFNNVKANIKDCSNTANIIFGRNTTAFNNNNSTGTDPSTGVWTNGSNSSFHITTFTGGIVGMADNHDSSSNTRIIKCNNSGNLWSYDGVHGGIIGFARTYVNVSGEEGNYCTNTGNVVYGAPFGNSTIKRPVTLAGGIVGMKYGGSSVKMSYCANLGDVMSSVYGAGGLVGRIISDPSNPPVAVSYCKVYCTVQTWTGNRRGGMLAGDTLGESGNASGTGINAGRVATFAHIAAGGTFRAHTSDVVADITADNLNKYKIYIKNDTNQAKYEAQTITDLQLWDGTSDVVWMSE